MTFIDQMLPSSDRAFENAAVNPTALRSELTFISIQAALEVIKFKPSSGSSYNSIDQIQ